MWPTLSPIAHNSPGTCASLLPCPKRSREELSLDPFFDASRMAFAAAAVAPRAARFSELVMFHHSAWRATDSWLTRRASIPAQKASKMEDSGIRRAGVVRAAWSVEHGAWSEGACRGLVRALGASASCKRCAARPCYHTHMQHPAASSRPANRGGGPAGLRNRIAR
jgi:hypothetical protein